MEILIFLGVVLLAIVLWPITLWLIIAWACFALHFAVGIIFLCLTAVAMIGNIS